MIYYTASSVGDSSNARLLNAIPVVFLVAFAVQCPKINTGLLVSKECYSLRYVRVWLVLSRNTRPS